MELSLYEAVTEALRAFEGADVDVELVRVDADAIVGFYGRLVGVEPIDDDGDLALQFETIGGNLTAGGVTLPALAEAEWRDANRYDAAGEPLPSTDRCLVIDVGEGLEVHLCHL